MTFNELPYAEACLEMLRAEDEEKIRRARALLRGHPIDCIDFSNPLSGFLETALS
jgi:hypothetical protein